MRTLHSSHDHFVMAGPSPNGSPKIFFRGSAYNHAQIGENTIVFSGRIDEIPGRQKPKDLSQTAKRLLEYFQEKKSFAGVKGQFIAIGIVDRTLRAHRSSFCGSSLYYGDRYISDNLFHLCRMENRHEISKQYVLNFILDIPAWQFDGNLSPIDNLFRIQSNSTLDQTDRGFKLTNHPQEAFSLYECPQQTHKDAGEIILNHLRQTIHDDLDSCGNKKIFCELSGGLDSSFTAALVAQARPGTKAYAYSFPDQPSHQQSIIYAKSVASKFSIPLEIVNGNDIEVPSIEDTIPIANEPADFFWQGALFGPVIKNICGSESVVFTGFGADQILNRTSSVVVSLLRQKKFSYFFATLRAMARDADRSTTNFLWQSILCALPRRIMLALMGVRAGEYRPFLPEELGDGLRHFQPIPWLNTGESFNARRSIASIFDQGELIQERYFKRCLAAPNLYYLSAPNVVWGGELGRDNIWQMHPFCDSRLITATFKDISWHLIHDWNSLYKQTLREAQIGILPEELRLRKRDDFSFDGFFLRFLRKNRGPLFEMALEASPLLESYFDKEQFENTFEQNIFGVQTIQTQKLNRFLGFAVWAKNFRNLLKESPSIDSLPEFT